MNPWLCIGYFHPNEVLIVLQAVLGKHGLCTCLGFVLVMSLQHTSVMFIIVQTWAYTSGKYISHDLASGMYESSKCCLGMSEMQVDFISVRPRLCASAYFRNVHLCKALIVLFHSSDMLISVKPWLCTSGMFSSLMPWQSFRRIYLWRLDCTRGMFISLKPWLCTSGRHISAKPWLRISDMFISVKPRSCTSRTCISVKPWLHSRHLLTSVVTKWVNVIALRRLSVGVVVVIINIDVFSKTAPRCHQAWHKSSSKQDLSGHTLLVALSRRSRSKRHSDFKSQTLELRDASGVASHIGYR